MPLSHSVCVCVSVRVKVSCLSTRTLYISVSSKGFGDIMEKQHVHRAADTDNVQKTYSQLINLCWKSTRVPPYLCMKLLSEYDSAAKFRAEEPQMTAEESRVEVLSLSQSGESLMGPRKSRTLSGYWEVWEVNISHLFFSGNPRQPPP